MAQGKDYAESKSRGYKAVSWNMSPDEQALINELRKKITGHLPAIIKISDLDILRYALDFAVKNATGK